MNSRAWREKNQERSRGFGRTWRAMNAEKERAKSARPEYVARRKRWKAENRGKVLAYVKARRLALKNRVPAWANRDAIARAYETAVEVSEATGVKHHVDHEVPLFGKRVSGLHVESNLRVVPADVNLRKNNRF